MKDSDSAIVVSLKDMAENMRQLNAAVTETAKEVAIAAATLKSAVDQADRHYQLIQDHEQRMRELERTYVKEGDLKELAAKVDQAASAAMTVDIKQKIIYGAGGAVAVAILAAFMNWVFTRPAPPAVKPAPPAAASSQPG